MPFLEENIAFKQSRQNEWQLMVQKLTFHIWRAYGQQRHKQTVVSRDYA